MFSSYLPYPRIILPLALLLSACSGGGSDSSSESPQPPSESPESSVFDVETNDSGIAELDFRLNEGTNKFTITATTEDLQQIQLLNLSDGRGENYLNPGGEFLTLSQLQSTGVAIATAPSRRIDPALDSSQGFFARTLIPGVGAGNIVRFTVSSKSDSDLNSGSLSVRILKVNSIANDPENAGSIEAAIQRFRDIYQSGAGVSLRLSENSIEGPNILPCPFEGANFYLENSTGTSSINLYLGSDVSDANTEILGIAGGIPGAPIATRRSAVVVSLVLAAGPNGVFEEEEIRILGETMAHESGHFLGLFHPVELESPDQVDPLPDTPGCSATTECFSIPELAMNLMFPAPVADGSGGFLPQNQLSNEQRGVINRHALVD